MSSSQGPRYPALRVRDARRRGDVAYLIDALTDPEVRGAAALSLGRVGAREAAPALVRNLPVKDDLDRNGAIKALMQIADKAAIPPLREVAGSDDAAGVRTTAMDALVTLGDKEGVEMLAALATDPATALASSSRFFDRAGTWSRSTTRDSGAFESGRRDDAIGGEESAAQPWHAAFGHALRRDERLSVWP